MNLFFASNVAYDPNLTLCPGMPDCWTHIHICIYMYELTFDRDAHAFWVNIL